MTSTTPTNSVTASGGYGSGDNGRDDNEGVGDGAEDDGYLADGGYIPAKGFSNGGIPELQGMDMKNLKKFSQKDRYGNSISFEFEVPSMQEIPHAEEYDHPGGPRGTDIVPAWLTPGERVMNAEAERMYGPQLKAMNDQGRSIQAAQGGTVPDYSTQEPQYNAHGGRIPSQGFTPTYAADGGVPVTQEGGFTATDLLHKFNQMLGGPSREDFEQVAKDRKEKYENSIKKLSDLKSEIRAGPYVAYKADGGVPVTQGEGFIPFDQLPGFEKIKEQEGFKLEAYPDVLKGKDAMTVGYGHKLLPEELGKDFTKEQLEQMYLQDFLKSKQAASENIPGYDMMAPEMQSAFTSQAFQLGKAGQADFEDMIAAINAGDKGKAIEEVYNSTWANQTPARAEYLANAIREGSLQQAKSAVEGEMVADLAETETGLMTPAGYLDADIFTSTGKFGKEVSTPSTPEQRQGRGVIPPLTDIPFVPTEVDEGVDNAIANQFVQIPSTAKQRQGKEGEEEPDYWDWGRIIGNLSDTPEQQKARQNNLNIRDDANAVRENELEKELAIIKGQDAGRVGSTFVPRPEEEITKELEEIKETRNQLRGFPSGVDGPEASELEKEKVVPVLPEASEGAEIPKPKEVEKEKAAQDVIKQFDPAGESDASNEVLTAIENAGNGSNPEDVKGVAGWLKKTFGSLYDEGELGRMAVMYMGSRALGYSHGGSLGFAAKGYVSRIDAKEKSKASDMAGRKKTMLQLIADGKVSSKNAQAYIKSGDISMLDTLINKGAPIPSGEYKDYYKYDPKLGKTVKQRAQIHTLSDKSKVILTDGGQRLNSQWTDDDRNYPGSVGYAQSKKDAISFSTKVYKERLANAKGSGKDGDEETEWLKNFNVSESSASIGFWNWAQKNNLSPDSDAAQGILGQAYTDAITDAQRGIRIPANGLQNYLDKQLWRETTGNHESWLLNPDTQGKDGPKYVSMIKMQELDNKADALARAHFGNQYDKNPDAARKAIYAQARKIWNDPNALDETEKAKYEGSGNEEVTGYWTFINTQLDKHQKKILGLMASQNN